MFEYPGAEAASKTITNCFYSANIWGDTKGRSLDDQVTEPVTIAGMPGYRTTGIVNFSHSPMELTSATELVVVVLETDQGPSVFVTETAVGVEAHEEAAERSLRVAHRDLLSRGRRDGPEPGAGCPQTTEEASQAEVVDHLRRSRALFCHFSRLSCRLRAR